MNKLRQRACEDLLDELSEHFQEVILLPAPEPKHHCHMIRGAINQNPTWYSSLYHDEGYVRRKTVEMVLKRIARTGEYSGKGRYEGLLQPIIEARMDDLGGVPF